MSKCWIVKAAEAVDDSYHPFILFYPRVHARYFHEVVELFICLGKLQATLCLAKVHCGYSAMPEQMLVQPPTAYAAQS